MTGQVLAIDEASLTKLKHVISSGGLAVIPTDTVYGIVCDPFNDQAIDALFVAKERPRSKSLQLLLPSLDVLNSLGLYLPEPLNHLAEKLLPGAFSPICYAEHDSRLKTLRREPYGETQAVRVPDCSSCRDILTVSGPLAASSANKSGQSSAQTVQEAFDQLGDKVDLYLDGGPTPGPVPSSVVASAPGQPSGIAILREGAIGNKSIYAALADETDRVIFR